MIFQTEKPNEITWRLLSKIQNAKPVGAVLEKEIPPAIQHGRCDGIRQTESFHSLYVSKVFSKNAENEEDTILGVRNDGIRKKGMCMSTAFTDDPGYTDVLIDSLSVDDIDDGSGIRGMSLAAARRMADGTF
ncbi:MAG: hypothetical protein PHX08_19990 [Lachnospiraceae bacterium]|nr:hypothetical protein [Lachnospiraceae bacterium]